MQSQGLEILGQIGDLRRTQAQRQTGVVSGDDDTERGGRPVVEVRRVLPDSLERRGAVLRRVGIGEERAAVASKLPAGGGVSESW